MRIKISIILPIYKVQEYLEDCLKSLLKQTLKEIEIILVDDESPDKCPEICDEYASRYPNIIVIHQKNKGSGGARNAGLLKAKGEYIYFVDPDDFIREDACEILYSHAIKDDLEVVLGCALRLKDGQEIKKKWKHLQENQLYTGEELLISELKGREYFPIVIWKNIYKREFLLNNQIFFKENIFHEDEEWTPRVFLKAQRIKYFEEYLYFHRIRPGSAQTDQSEARKVKRGNDIISVANFLATDFESIKDSVLRTKLIDYLVFMYFRGIHSGEFYSHDAQIKAKKFLKGKAQTKSSKIKVKIYTFCPIIYRIVYKTITALRKINT